MYSPNCQGNVLIKNAFYQYIELQIMHENNSQSTDWSTKPEDDLLQASQNRLVT